MNKSFYKQLILVILMMTGISSSLFALDVYLAPSTSGGSDTNTGEFGSPVATLTKAYSLIPGEDNNGHKIHISGYIDITAESVVPATLASKKYCTIDGGDPITSGFDGKETVGLIILSGNKGEITFKNLTFKNGKATQGGILTIINAGIFIFENCNFNDNSNPTNANSGNIHVFNSNVTFDNCNFDSNTGQRGGVFWMNTNAVATIKNCHFINNSAIVSGGAIFQQGTAINKLENCVFENNTANGYVIENATTQKLTILNCQFKNNQAGGINCSNAAGKLDVRGSLFKENINPNTSMDGGGIRTANSTNFIEGTAIIGNSSKRSGGGVSLTLPNGNASFKMINTTVADNNVVNRGGAIFVDGIENITNEILLLNVTATNNSTTSAGDDNAAVCLFTTVNKFLNHLSIYNTIIENNLDGNLDSKDIRIRNLKDALKAPSEQGKFSIKNSIIKYAHGDNTAGTSVLSTTDIENSNVGGRGGVEWPTMNYQASGLYQTLDATYNVYPLANISALAYNFGASSLLAAEGYHTDQLKQYRQFIDGMCHAGAAEYVQGEGVIITTTKKTVDKTSSVYVNANNKIIVKADLGSTVTVFNTSGQKVINQYITNKTMMLDTPLRSGIYLVMINNLTTKVLIK